MDYLNPVTVGGISAMVFGLLLIVSGLHARRHGRLQKRQGAQVLAAVIIAVGLSAMVAGALYLVGA